jgi:type IV secretory pathway VirD2 relaxase
MYNDDLPIFRPDLGGKVRADRVPKFRNQLLKRFPKVSGLRTNKNLNPKRGGHPNRGHYASHVKNPRLFSRRVVVKARIVKMNKYGKIASDMHLNYIEREGVEKDGSKGKLFNGGKDFKRDDFMRQIQSEPHQFRLIISPEDAHELDLTDFTRRLMNQMEVDLGRKLEWAAVNHYNTDNPHTHVVIRGLDREGKELRIDRDYISNGIRNRAREIVTAELGMRTELDIENQINKEIAAERVTSIDFQIEKNMAGGILNLGEYPTRLDQRCSQARIMSRMEKLEGLGLAAQVGYRKWELEPGWKERLKELGERNDIIKTMHRNISGDPGRYRILDTKTFDGVIEGKLVLKGLADEMYDKTYFIVETHKGDSFYIALDKGVNESAFQEGEVVKIGVVQEKWLKPADQNIARIADNNNGVYSKERHLNSIASSHVIIEGKFGKKISVEKNSFVNAHERRLQRLLRFNLVSQLQDGAWSIPGDLVPKLVKRDKENPVKKLDIKSQSKLSFKEQIKYKGRTWLDRYACGKIVPETAKYGFGAELSRLARIRANFLIGMGLDPADSMLAKKLDTLEFNELGNRLETESNMKFSKANENQGRIKAKLTKLETLPSGRRYAQLLDLKSRQFMLVPWRKEYEALHSKVVETQFDTYGRAMVKKYDMNMGR